MNVRKLKPDKKTNLPPVSKVRLKRMIEEAVVDAYNEEEQAVGFLTMIQDHLALPFSTTVVGVEASVEKVEPQRRVFTITSAAVSLLDRVPGGCVDMP